jgi:hypothetical protein
MSTPRCGSFIRYSRLLFSFGLLLCASFMTKNLAYIKITKTVINHNEMKTRNYILILSCCLISHILHPFVFSEFPVRLETLILVYLLMFIWGLG